MKLFRNYFKKLFRKTKDFLVTLHRHSNVVCDKWELKFMFRKRITGLEELSEFLAEEFPHEEVIMLIFDKLYLLREDPKKYAREKLKNQTDKDGRPLFSIEVTGDIRIVNSFEPKSCTVFIWRIGKHKKAYRF